MSSGPEPGPFHPMGERPSARDEDAGDADVPCPREVWRAALKDRRISVTVQPDRTPNGSASAVTYSGHITTRRKTGGPWSCYVTVEFVPDGELAGVELEAGKENGEWGPFRAFHWKRPHFPKREGPHDHRYMYVGKVTALDIPDAHWNRSGEDPEPLDAPEP